MTAFETRGKLADASTVKYYKLAVTHGKDTDTEGDKKSD